MKQKVILFGASNLGKATYEYIKDKYNVMFFCDNDEKKWKKNFYSTEVKNPEILKQEEYKQVKIIIASMYFNEIYKQLIKYGIKEENIELSDFKIKKIQQKQYEYNQYKSFKKVIDNFTQNKKCNLHIMIDNFFCKRFINFVNENFDNKEHKFIILTNFESKIKYVDNIEKYENTELLYINEMTDLKLYFYAKNSKKLFIHYLTDYVCKFIYDYKVWNETELNWNVWGGDFYEDINYELYDKDTNKFFINNNINVLKHKNESYIFKAEVIKKMKNILTPIRGDYEIIRKSFETSAKYIRFLYPNPVKYKKPDYKLDEKYNFKNKYDFIIQVGNSGDPSNNHVDIFNKLRKIDLKNSCIICPLSYGNPDYISKVSAYGNEVFGEKFIPIKTFLRQDTYFNLLSSVDIAIMGHNRQQGFSNILLLLYLGKKIYLKENITSYKELINLGASISSLKELENIKNINEIETLTEINKEINKDIVLNWFSDKKALEHLREIFI